jgi:hypothetical protein
MSAIRYMFCEMCDTYGIENLGCGLLGYDAV